MLLAAHRRLTTREVWRAFTEEAESCSRLPSYAFSVFSKPPARIITRWYTLKHKKVVTFAFNVYAFKLLQILSLKEQYKFLVSALSTINGVFYCKTAEKLQSCVWKQGNNQCLFVLFFMVYGKVELKDLLLKEIDFRPHAQLF